MSRKIVLSTKICVIVIAVAVIVWFSGRAAFRRNASKTLLHAVELKTIEFEANLNSQLTLVRQLIRSPSISNYFENPYDEEFRSAAYQEFEAYCSSFLSKSIFWVSDTDRKFYQDMEYKYTVDPESPDTYWYKMTLYETEEYNFNINYNPDLDVTMLWVNAVVRNKAGTAVGIAGTGIPLTDFINSMYRGLNESILMYLYDADLKITGAQDKTILAAGASLREKMSDIPENMVLPEETTVLSTVHNQYVLAPLSLINWYMAMRIPLSPKFFVINAITPFAVCLAIIIIATAVLLCIQLGTNIATLRKAVDELSSGNADLTKRVQLGSRSSITVVNQLVDSVNTFIKKLQTIVASVKESNGSLVESGEKLTSSTEDSASSITEILANIQQLDQNLSKQTGSVDQTAGAIEHISEGIKSLNTLITSQTDSVSEASAAVEQMLGNISSVNSISQRLEAQFAELNGKTVQSVTKQEQVNEMIMKVQEQSQMLQEANLVISSIAEQTSLLAMNAAIEAAHAGEAGKGFSVVADEISKLSENSSQQSKTIGDQLSYIENSISSIVDVSKDSQEMLSTVTDDLKNTDALIREIGGAMKEQQEGSNQINTALSMLRNNSTEVLNSSQQMSEKSLAIIDSVKTLENATAEMKTGMSEMLTGAKKINDTSNALSVISTELGDSIKNISVQLDQFKA